MAQAWLERVRLLLSEGPYPLAVLADETYGVAHALAELERSGTAVWLHLREGDDLASISAGNRIAEALNRYAGVHLYDLGHPARAVLAMVEAEGAPRLPLALSGAGYGPELRERLERVWGRERLLLAGKSAHPEGYATVNEEALALTREEALALARALGEEDEAVVEQLWKDARGAYETFRQALHERLGLPPLFRPYPDGPEPPPACRAAFDPRRMLALLLRQGRLAEAFPLAARHDPETALRIAEEASEVFLARGEYARLAELLEGLLALYPDEAVLVRGWYEAKSGAGEGREETTVRRVVEFLERHKAPDLEALLTAQHNVIETEVWDWTKSAPWEAAETPYTLLAKSVVEWRRSQPGKTHFEVAAARAALLAAERGKGRLAVVAADRAAGILLPLGRYREALHWAEWAMQGLEEYGVHGATERVRTTGTWVETRLLRGRPEGVVPLAERTQALLSAADPRRRRLFTEILAFAYLATGRPGDALELWGRFFAQNTGPKWRGQFGGSHALALWAAGEDAAALEAAEQAMTLVRPQHPRVVIFTLVQYLAILSEQDPKRALVLRDEVEELLELPGFGASYWITARLSLAAAYQRLGDVEAAQAEMAKTRPYLEELVWPEGYAYYLGKPEAFAEVAGPGGRAEGLELRLLGSAPRATLAGRPLRLSGRSLELLVALAYRGARGGEALMLDVYGDEGNLGRLKVAVSKLREQVPVASQPYRLEVPVKADFLEVELLLREGRLREAAALYAGPLLPESSAPVVVELREALEEALRQAALTQPGEAAAMDVAAKLEGDLELWEALLAAVSPDDPRAAFVAARVKMLRKEWEV